MTTITRRGFLGAVGAAAALGAAPRAGLAQPSIKVGAAVLGDYALAGPFVLAMDKNMFRAEGLNADFVTFRGGPDLVKAVAAGELLLGAAGSTDVLVSREAGMPLKMIATQTEGNHFTLNVAPSIQGLADLKGKAIGVTRAGATTWVFARMLAREQKWEVDRDVRIVALGALDAQLAALGRNEIAAFVWGDGGAVAQLQGKSKVLMRLDRVTPKWISQVICASEDGIRKQGDTIRKALKVVFAAQQMMREKTAESAEIIAKKLGWTPDAVQAAHRISGGLISADGTMSIEALATIQDILLENGIIKKKLPVEQHVAKEFTPVRLGTS
jgi:ABC-type nitrate/sulfonate/bicarbonate transport system substrate-binding protein